VFSDNQAQASAGGFRSNFFLPVRHNTLGILHSVIKQIASFCSLLCGSWSECLVTIIDLLLMY